MNLVDFNQRVPAGLLDDGTGEFYISEDEMWLSYRKQQYKFDEFPSEVLEIIYNDMANEPLAVGCLVEDFKLLDLKSQTRQYLACRHGGFDCAADLTSDGKLTPSEYVDCGRRGGVCKSEGKLCTSILLKNGKLTAMEILTLTDVGAGLLDKEIADKRGISEHTVRHQKDSICRKSGLERKPALVGLAFKLGLVSI